MIRLDNVTKLKIGLAIAVSSDELPVSVSWSDLYNENNVYNEKGGSQESETNGSTLVEIAPSPKNIVFLGSQKPTIRNIDFINVSNIDSAGAEVTIYKSNATDDIKLITVTLSVGDTLQYTHDHGWKVIDSTGATKGVGPTGSVGPAGPGVPTGGTANQVLAKINGTNYNTYWMTLPVGLGYGIVNVSTSPYSVVPTTGTTIYLVDATAGNIVINLPTAVSNTAMYSIKKVDASANTVTITPNGVETIDGAATQVILFQNTAIDVFSDGVNLLIK